VRARAVMVLGTSSHVGKSLIAVALCRIFAQEGYRVAPFKSQNMSLNSAATADGLEIGRAQALQAEAAGIAATAEMNPILIKPTGEMCSQIVVRGNVWGRLTAAEYFERRVEELWPVVQESYEALAAAFDVIVIEGAGSPAEINLKAHDIVNMRVAAMADASCLLVGDIDRGGVFASLLGTVELLEPGEQARIRGFAINKFRGDVRLLEPGVRIMVERMGKPCVGVVRYMAGLALEEEDSLGLAGIGLDVWSEEEGADRRLRVAVIAFPTFSNFTDFDSVRAEPTVSLRFCRTAEEMRGADVVVLPGSKQTVEDLLWMRANGVEAEVLAHAREGLVVGVCGGMQMLGEWIEDPSGMEHVGSVPGMGLLPIRTTMRERKVTSQAAGRVTAERIFGEAMVGVEVRGYEIHLGETAYDRGAKRFAELERRPGERHEDGCVRADSRVFGTYLHGIFDADGFRARFISAARRCCGLLPAVSFNDWTRRREESLDRLAVEVRGALEMETIFGWVGMEYRGEVGAGLGTPREAV